MVEFTLVGHVHPTAKSFTLTFPFGLEFSDLGLTIEPVIQNGQVSVVCQAPAFDPGHLNLALLVVRAKVGGIVSLYTVGTGDHYSLHIDSVVPPGATAKGLLNLSNPDLAALCTAFNPHGNMTEIFEIVLTDDLVMTIINDAAMAITQALYQPIACGRVLDGIRNHIAPGIEKREGWKRVHAALNLTPDYARFVSDKATKPRHREAHSFGDREVGDCLRRTWIILDRFLHHLKRGKAPLSAPEFPLL